MIQIKRYRKTQPLTMDDFIDNAIEEQACKNCVFYEECKSYIPDLDDCNITGCKAFDNSIENLEQLYIKQYC